MTMIRLVNASVLDAMGQQIGESLCIEDGRIAEAAPGAVEFDLSGAYVVPGLTDLYGAIGDVKRDLSIAATGGFSRVVAACDAPQPMDTVDSVHSLLGRAADHPVEVLATSALTVGLRGESLAEIGLLRDAGCVAAGQGHFGVPSSVVLMRAMSYAARLGIPLWLRGMDAELEAEGVVARGDRAVQLGLPDIPQAAEEVGIHQIIALARTTGAQVHITHVWTAAGVRAIASAKADGLPITASASIWNLAFNPERSALSPYDGRLRFSPPVGGANDREALVNGVRSGVIDAVASDHALSNSTVLTQAIQEAEPGSPSRSTVLLQLIEALDGDVGAAVRALCGGPERVLGQARPSMVKGELVDMAVVDMRRHTLVGQADKAMEFSPITGVSLRGQVRATWARGTLVHGTVGSLENIG